MKRNDKIRCNLESSITLLSEVVTDAVANGYFVTLPSCNIRPGIKGDFTSPADSFDKARHVKKATISAGLPLPKNWPKPKCRKPPKQFHHPMCKFTSDVNSGEANSVLTPGGIGAIEGSEVKFDTGQGTNVGIAGWLFC